MEGKDDIQAMRLLGCRGHLSLLSFPNIILLITLRSLPSALILITWAYLSSSLTISLGFRGLPRFPVGENLISFPYCFRRADVYNFNPSVTKRGIDRNFFAVFATRSSAFL